MRLAAPAPGALHKSGRVALWVLAGGLLITAALSGWTWSEAMKRDEERFRNMAEQFRQEFETRVERYELGLLHLADWFADNELASQAQWENRVDRMGLQVNFPGVIEICYAPVIHSPNIVRWRGRAPAHWPPESEWDNWSFQVWYQATQPPGASHGWGRKLRDEVPILREDQWIISTARFLSSGRLMVPTLTGGEPLAGFALMTGAHRRDLPPVSGLDKPEYAHWPRHRGLQLAQAITGVVMATIGMEPLLDSIFGGRNLEIDCEIYAGAVAGTNRMNRLGKPPLTPEGAAFFSSIEIPWYYNRWNIVAVPNARFHLHSHRGRVWAVAGSGTLLTLAMAWVFRTQERARASAVEWGRNLEAAREELRVAHRERLRLGRDLHDGALQSIYASVLGLRRARRAVEKDPAVTGRLIEAAASDLEGAMQDIRCFLSSTRQEGVSAENLPEILRGFVDAFNRVEQSHVTLDFPPAVAGTLNGEQAEQLMHVVKEGVSNAHRHGRAPDVRVAFRMENGAVQLTIHDNGVGFVPGQAASGGYGLQYMSERAAICGGKLRIDSRPGGPTTLELVIPGNPDSTREEQG
jgi:signal transduction histidine kinase